MTGSEGLGHCKFCGASGYFTPNYALWIMAIRCVSKACGAVIERGFDNIRTTAEQAELEARRAWNYERPTSILNR